MYDTFKLKANQELEAVMASSDLENDWKPVFLRGLAFLRALIDFLINLKC